ncbi:MAG: tetratricopeptide repeat protein [Chloroflexota bacterium]|nr:tetratricopeptide repeat protein [Chloroflexota bacterium]
MRRPILAITLVAALLVIAGIGYAIYHFANEQSEPIPELITRQIETLENEVNADPDNPTNHVELAAKYAEAGAYDSKYYDMAFEECDAALELEENMQSALLLTGRIHIMIEEYQKALDPLLLVIDLNQNEPELSRAFNEILKEAYYYSGLCYVELGQGEQAIAQLEERLDLSSGAPASDIITTLGSAYYLIGDYDQAIELYNDAVRFDLIHIEAYEGLVEAYEAKGESNKALYAQGMVSYCLEDYEDAVDKLKQAVSVDQTLAWAYQCLGMAHEELFQINEAIEAYQQAVQLNPELCWFSQGRLTQLGASSS